MRITGGVKRDLVMVLSLIGFMLCLLFSVAMASDAVLVLENFDGITTTSQLNLLVSGKENLAEGNYWDFRFAAEPTEISLIPGHDGTGNALEVKTTIEPLGVKWIHLWFDPALDISEYTKLTLWYSLSHGVSDLARSHPFQVRIYDANSNRVESQIRQEYPKDDSWLMPNQWHKLVIYLAPDAPSENYPQGVVVGRRSRIDDTLDRDGVARFIVRVENSFTMEPIYIRLDDIQLEK
jgi:hypothetical protein